MGHALTFRIACITGMVAATLSYARSAHAFSTMGHRVLEASAYRQVLTNDRGALKPEGVQLIRELIADGVLAKPPCLASESGCGKDQREEDPMLWWPVPGTDRPDMIFARQFSKAGQCYHFMAIDEDEASSKPGQPSQKLLEAAPNRCVRQLDELVRFIVADPVRAHEQRMGTYELLHAIADSYSRAHAEREYDTWDRADGTSPTIRFLRVWQPTVTLPWEGESKATRHEIFEERDDNFVDRSRVHDGRPCTAHLEKPYFVPRACLSEEGALASRAMGEALGVIAALRRRFAGKPVGSERLAEWETFKSRHFALRSPVTNPPVLPTEHVPELAIGILNRYEDARVRGARSHDMRLEGRLLYGGPDMEPATFMPGISVGARQLVRSSSQVDRHEVQAVVRTDAAFGVQAFKNVFFELTPLSFELARGKGFAFNAYANARVEWLATPTVAIAIVSPEYSWPTGKLHTSVGLTASLLLGRSTGGPAPIARESVAAHATGGAGGWSPPDYSDVELRSRRGPTILQFFAGAAGGNQRAEGGRADGRTRQGAELLLFKRNAWNERRRFALALGLATSVEFGGNIRGSRRNFPALSAEPYLAPRLYIAGPLALVPMAGFDTGNRIDRDPGFAARLGLMLSLGLVDVTFESPTFTYQTNGKSGFLPEEILGIRFSLETIRFN